MIHWHDDTDDPHADELDREQRWTAFVEWCKGDRPKSDSDWSTLLYHVYQNMRSQASWHYPQINQVILDFHETEGWDGVLGALARAYREAK